MRKNRKIEEHENNERWLVSYADFITLLFAFFVVMYATSTSNEEKQKEFEESIKVNLHLVGKVGDGGSANKSILDEAFSDVGVQLGSYPEKGGPKEVEDYVQRYLDKNLAEEDKKDIQSVHHDAVGVKISLAASTMFQEGSSKILPQARGALDKLADLLKTNNKKVIIEGHTDNTPMQSAQFASNWELAGSRASTVIRYFTKVHQIDAARFISISYGDQKPIVPNSTDENRRINRRIEIYLITDEAKSTL